MGILPSCSHVSTTVWLHHMNSNKMFGGKDTWKLHKNAIRCSKQILEAALHKTAM